MKKVLAVLLAGMMAVGLVACGEKAPVSESSVAPAGESTSAAAPEDGKIIKIGVVQLVKHDALDAAYKGFVDGLKDAGYEDGKNIKIDYKNAQGEQSNCVTIADKLVNDGNDLLLAIATPAAQALANKTKDIPILVTAVTDPADAKLVATNEAPGGNVTGTSDLNPIKAQMALLQKLVPNAKKVAMLYSSNETNSAFQVAIAKEELKALGIETVDATVSNSNEIQQVVQSLVGKVDAIYAPTDNLISAGMATVSMVATPEKLPIIGGEGAMVPNGALASDGLDYYNLGKQTAAMAVRILKGEGTPATMPVEYLKETKLTINTDIVEQLGMTVPVELLQQAELVTMAKAE